MDGDRRFVQLHDALAVGAGQSLIYSADFTRTVSNQQAYYKKARWDC